MRRVYKEIKEFVDKNNITLPSVIESLKNFKAYEKGTLASSEGPVKARYGYLSYALMMLVEAKNPHYLKFCRKYGKITDEYRIEEWFFSPSYIQWEGLNQRMTRIQLTKIWYSWDKLVNFYNVYHNYETIQKRNIESNKIWDTWGLSMLFQEIKDILDEKKQTSDQIRYFKHEEYLLHLERVHLFTKEVLLEANKKQLQYEKKYWTYNPKTGIFRINEKVVQFKKNGLRAKILELISKNDKNKRKTWSWDELFEKIE